jgi:hypothetical protein
LRFGAISPFLIQFLVDNRKAQALPMTMRHDVRLAQALSALRRLQPRRAPPVTTAGELVDFLAARSAYVAQRSVIEYCRARTGPNWEKLFSEPSFLERLEECRWEAYAAVLGEVAARAALLRHPVPAHRTGWGDAVEAIERHLARALLAAPHPVHLLGIESATAIFDLLPIHADLRRQDRTMFQSTVRFAICRVFDETRRFDVPALEAALGTVGAEPAASPGAP